VRVDARKILMGEVMNEKAATRRAEKPRQLGRKKTEERR